LGLELGEAAPERRLEDSWGGIGGGDEERRSSTEVGEAKLKKRMGWGEMKVDGDRDLGGGDMSKYREAFAPQALSKYIATVRVCA
jgi:hypothetical protein